MADLVVVCEAEADFRTVTTLADRVFVERLPWAEGVLDSVRCWCGAAPGDRFVKWTSLKSLCNAHPGFPRLHGRYRGPGAKGEWLQVRKAIVWTRLARPEAAGLVVARDDDRKGRRAAMDQAACEAPAELPVVVAHAVPEREAWHIVGFVPTDDAEATRVDGQRAALGGDPHRVAHTLDPKKDDAPRGTKRVLDALTHGDHARQARCLTEPPLEDLRARGDDVGLTVFLNDVVRLADVLGAG